MSHASKNVVDNNQIRRKPFVHKVVLTIGEVMVKFYIYIFEYESKFPKGEKHESF